MLFDLKFVLVFLMNNFSKIWSISSPLQCLHLSIFHCCIVWIRERSLIPSPILCLWNTKGEAPLKLKAPAILCQLEHTTVPQAGTAGQPPSRYSPWTPLCNTNQNGGKKWFWNITLTTCKLTLTTNWNSFVSFFFLGYIDRCTCLLLWITRKMVVKSEVYS
jgi:hypothetical protein